MKRFILCALFLLIGGISYAQSVGVSYITVGTSEDKHVVKSSPGRLYSIHASNVNAAVRYLKCENDTSANTAPGTDTPEIRVVLPPNGQSVSLDYPMGLTFTNALTCWIVTGAADSDVTEAAANEIFVTYSIR